VTHAQWRDHAPAALLTGDFLSPHEALQRLRRAASLPPLQDGGGELVGTCFYTDPAYTRMLATATAAAAFRTVPYDLADDAAALAALPRQKKPAAERRPEDDEEEAGQDHAEKPTGQDDPDDPAAA
jgi:hypothetical protein